MERKRKKTHTQSKRRIEAQANQLLLLPSILTYATFRDPFNLFENSYPVANLHNYYRNLYGNYNSRTILHSDFENEFVCFVVCFFFLLIFFLCSFRCYWRIVAIRTREKTNVFGKWTSRKARTSSHTTLKISCAWSFCHDKTYWSICLPIEAIKLIWFWCLCWVWLPYMLRMPCKITDFNW